MFIKPSSRTTQCDYSVEFWIMATESGCNSETLRGMYLHGLGEQMKNELS